MLAAPTRLAAGWLRRQPPSATASHRQPPPATVSHRQVRSIGAPGRHCGSCQPPSCRRVCSIGSPQVHTGRCSRAGAGGRAHRGCIEEGVAGLAVPHEKVGGAVGHRPHRLRLRHLDSAEGGLALAGRRHCTRGRGEGGEGGSCASVHAFVCAILHACAAGSQQHWQLPPPGPAAPSPALCTAASPPPPLPPRYATPTTPPWPGPALPPPHRPCPPPI